MTSLFFQLGSVSVEQEVLPVTTIQEKSLNHNFVVNPHDKPVILSGSNALFITLGIIFSFMHSKVKTALKILRSTLRCTARI